MTELPPRLSMDYFSRNLVKTPEENSPDTQSSANVNVGNGDATDAKETAFDEFLDFLGLSETDPVSTDQQNESFKAGTSVAEILDFTPELLGIETGTDPVDIDTTKITGNQVPEDVSFVASITEPREESSVSETTAISPEQLGIDLSDSKRPKVEESTSGAQSNFTRVNSLSIALGLQENSSSSPQQLRIDFDEPKSQANESMTSGPEFSEIVSEEQISHPSVKAESGLINASQKDSKKDPGSTLKLSLHTKEDVSGEDTAEAMPNSKRDSNLSDRSNSSWEKVDIQAGEVWKWPSNSNPFILQNASQNSSMQTSCIKIAGLESSNQQMLFLKRQC